MVKKNGDGNECRLRMDPVLVDKFRRLQGGINEVGTKIVRDLGLRYQYDKNRGTLEIIGQDSEILALAAETLRFWVEDDDFPDTGITCQVGYPNRNIVIWRFHGDYAKKFDHLFADDIAKLKLITSVNIKAVPTKRNPEYVELFCHFNVYRQVKPEVERISKELGRIFQDDFFIPKSDFQKAREFAISKTSDDKVLYALKEYPDNKIRVWLFARDQMDVIRARKEWVLHVGIIARDNEFTETLKKDLDSFKSASFFGHPASEIVSDVSGPTTKNRHAAQNESHSGSSKKTPQTSLNLSISRHSSRSKAKSTQISPRTPRSDNPNFPRPLDFPYPVQKEQDPAENIHTIEEELQNSKNPFEGNLDSIDVEINGDDLSKLEGKWVMEDESKLPRSKKLSHKETNRIYVHHQINDPGFQTQVQPNDTIQSALPTNLQAVTEEKIKQIVHPEKNLVERERFNPTHHSRSVLTSVTDPLQAPKIKRGNKALRPGEKGTKKPTIHANTRQKRPTLKSQKTPPSIRYNISVNGLNIFMYKQNITKLTNMDVLVNVVSTTLKEGDLVATTMFEEAGKQVTDELDVHISLYGYGKTADNVVTSAGRLAALGIIHVVAPVWKEYTVWQDCASDLHKALYNALKTAETHKYRKIGIPVIGSEPFFGIPKDLVAEVYVKALIDYSMGMGPMYPVLEVHLVDTDPNMLTYIKDAYESWASTPGVADMTKHIKTGTDQIISDPNEVSNRAQSAVSLKSTPAHRSENMVTFVEQSYTKEGEQKWTFDVLKKLTVHVYTGSVLKLDNVEAIVCAVDADLKGTLAKQIQYLGGKKYQFALKAARGNRMLVEGEVLVCDGGELGVKKVLHSVIAAPVHTASQKNLSRLDNINTQVFVVASQQDLKTLAMPLIGTSRLRERFEVEQCSLQLIDNIIEMCLSLGNGLKLKELHLVNTNHVMTQYLTQALRTRAHTKLRVEAEPHMPSRQEVLTKAEAIRGTPEKIETQSVKCAKTSDSKGSKSKSKKLTKSNEGRVNNDKNKEAQAATSDKKQQEIPKDHPDNAKSQQLNFKNMADPQTRPNENEKVRDKKVEINENNITDGGNKKKDKRRSQKNVPYLSQKNLEKHNKMIREAWMHLMDDEMEGLEYKVPEPKPKRPPPRRHQQLEPLDEGFIVKKAEEFFKERRKENPKQHRKKKHRIIQRSSDFVMQRSKAESYKTLFEKKKNYAEAMHKQEMYKLRKTQSSDDILKNQLADEVFQTFKEERKRLARQKELAVKPEIDLTEQEKNEKEQFEQTTRKYFTRDTRDRYKLPNEQSREESINEKFEKINRLDVAENFPREEPSTFQRKAVTDRSDRPSGIPRLKRPRHFVDKEREDQYMMDMDFLVKEKEKRVQETEEVQEDINTKEGGIYDNKSASKSDKSSILRRNRLLALTSQDKPSKPVRGKQKQTFPKGRLKKFSHRAAVKHKVNKTGFKDAEKMIPIGTRQKQDIASNRQEDGGKLEKNDSGISLKEPENERQAVEMSLQVSSRPDNENIILEHELNPGNDLDPRRSDKTYKTYTVNGDGFKSTNPNVKPPEIVGDRVVGRAQFVQSYNPAPRYLQPSKLKKTVEWKNGTKITKQALEEFHQQRHLAARAPRPDEVTIRDKIKLQINVVDNKNEDTKEILEEKRKIKRFWEVVGGKDVNNEKELYGESENKDKVIVAKVTKERKMSAKSKTSKLSRSNQTVTTHNVGPFDVTLEVAT